MTTDKLRILVVEDESLIAEMIKVMLEDMGHTVPYVAYNKAAAMDFLQTREIDFAIFDINLKEGMEGVALARIAQAEGIPFMFLTSYSDRATIDVAKLTKPGAYVLKPFSEEELYSGIEMSLMHLSSKRDRMVTIKDGPRNIVLKVGEVVMIKAENVYVEIFTLSKRFLVRQSLTAFLEELAFPEFVRVHRSYAINKLHVTTHTRNTVQVGEFEVPISRSYREEALFRLQS